MTADTTLRGPERADVEETGSPLSGYVHPFADLAAATGGAIRIAERPSPAQVCLRADPGTDVGASLGGPLPAPGQVTTAGALRTLGLGPDEWLIVGPAGAQENLVAELAETVRARGAVVDVSGERTVLALTGPKFRELLAKGCALDLHPRVFLGDRCAQTQLARAQVILLSQPESLWLLVRSSFARYVADWLLDAALEYRRPVDPGR